VAVELYRPALRLNFAAQLFYAYKDHRILF